MSLERIVVVGTSGSGKTHFARRAAAALGAPHIEIDALHWRPGWQHVSPEELRASLAPRLAEPTWVVDGNYRAVRDLVWSRATALVWLKYPFPLVLSRLVRRSVRRAWTRETVCNGNRESLRSLLLGREALFPWAFTSHPRLLRSYPDVIARNPHLDVHVFTWPSQADRFLRRVREGSAPLVQSG